MAWTFYNSNGEALIEDGAAIAATQAQMEAASSTDDSVFVTPGRTQFHPGVAKAWFVHRDTTTLDATYNSAGVVNDATGRYTFSIGTDMSSTEYIVVAINESDNDATIVRTSSDAAGSFQLSMRSGGSLAAANLQVVVFGTQV